MHLVGNKFSVASLWNESISHRMEEVVLIIDSEVAAGVEDMLVSYGVDLSRVMFVFLFHSFGVQPRESSMILHVGRNLWTESR